MSDARVRLGIVGCGAIAHWHLDAIERAGARVDVTAAVDPDAERAGAIARRCSTPTYASLGDALAAPACDAVLIAVPHHLHEPVACEALRAGVHVLLEKPIATTVETAERILAAAHDGPVDRVFMVAENAQYWPEVRTVRSLLDDGAIGEVVTARAATFFPALGEFYAPAPDGTPAWRLDAAAAGGGVALDTGSHWLRPLRVWLGEIDETVAALGRPLPEMQGESLCRALLRFESGVVAAFDAMITTGAVAPAPFFTVTGTEGEITVEASGWVKLYDGSDWKGAKVGTEGGYLASYEGQWLDFAAAVLDGTPPAVPAAYALGELGTALAMYRSAASGCWEKVWT